jgi:hypothetical protein
LRARGAEPGGALSVVMMFDIQPKIAIGVPALPAWQIEGRTCCDKGCCWPGIFQTTKFDRFFAELTWQKIWVNGTTIMQDAPLKTRARIQGKSS